MIHGISKEEILEKTENSLFLKVKIPSESDYFDGHFPQFKLLPAVAQIDLLVHYANKYLMLPLSTLKIKRFKFSDKILPDTVVIFKIQFDSEKNRLSFDISNEKDGRTYSSGTYMLK